MPPTPPPPTPIQGRLLHGLSLKLTSLPYISLADTGIHPELQWASQPTLSVCHFPTSAAVLFKILARLCPTVGAILMMGPQKHISYRHRVHLCDRGLEHHFLLPLFLME